MKNLVRILLTFFTIGIAGCAKEGCTNSNACNYDSSAKKDDGTCYYNCGGGGGNTTAPLIYYRWTEDLSYLSWSDGLWCDVSVAPYYNNSHPDIPDYATKNQYYGPVSAGSFTIELSSIGGGTITKTLYAPASGYKRYYTHRMKEFYDPLNRCVLVGVQTTALTYEDKPL